MITPPPTQDDDARDMARTDAFSDGVIAIAMTLLAFALVAPTFEQAAASGGLLRALLAQWPDYLAFFTSFLTIIILWVNHHRLFNMFRAADQTLMILNGLLLLAITVVPFTTSLIADYLLAPESSDMIVAAMIYAGWFFVIALCFQLVWRYVLRHRSLLRPSITDEHIRQINQQYRKGPPVYLIAVVFALVNPLLSVLITLGVALWYAIPPRQSR